MICPECGEDTEKRFQCLTEERDAAEAAIKAIVATAGGIVEGNPPGSHNILQRIRELRTIEQYAAEEHWLPYWLELAKEGQP